jgi:hypothetical protein
MEQSKSTNLNYLSLFFAAILLVLILGFYRTYLVFFPKFPGFHYEQHFHGMLMLLWLTLLIVQPILISSKNFRIHRFLGKMTLILAPLIILSIFLVAKMTYHRTLAAVSPQAAVGITALSLPNMFGFALFYYLAIFNSDVMQRHMRYMIGTSFLMLGPGLGRILIVGLHWPIEMAVNVTNMAGIILAAVFLVTDIRRKGTYLPYLVIFITLVLIEGIWLIKMTPLWQVPAKAFADLLY